jgi:hypothetical protein
VVVAVDAPVKAIVAPLPAAPTEPETVHVCNVAVIVAAVTFAPLTVTATLAGANVSPLLVGVIV